MINVTLYKMDKRSNSTKQPTANDTSVTISCVLLDSTSVINPTLLFQQTGSIELDLYNYAYIAVFGRYYFITNIVRDSNNLYTIYLATDVLGSFRTSIRNSTQYVVRSSSSKDDNIVDTMYITKPFSTSQRSAVSSYASGYVSRKITSDGEPATGQIFYFNYGLQMPVNSVCFGIVGENGVGANYYVATEDNFISFMTQVFTVIPSDMGSIADGLKKVLADINQYIISVVRLPVMPHTSNLGVAKSSVKLGSHNIPCTCYSFIPGYHYEEYMLSNDLSLPQHPNISTHSYYAMPPYTNYVLDFLPLGSVPLDTAKLYGKTSINVSWRLDYISGLAWFKVGYTSGNEVVPLFTDIAQVGIPIPLSQLKVDNATGFGLVTASAINNWVKNNSSQTGSGGVREVANNIGTNFGQSVKDFFSAAGRLINGDKRKMIPAETEKQSLIGNIFDGNTNVIDQIIDYAGEIFGNVQTKGSTGSYLNIIGGTPSVRAFFIDQAENDNDRFGSPLYQKKVLSTLTGFCVCKNANITTFSEQHLPLNHERSAINVLLNSGIYLE